MRFNLYNKQYLLVLLAITFFCACRTGKEYQQPELALPNQFSSISFSDNSSIGDIEWKEFFTDTTLLALIEKGISYNNDLLVAVKRIDIAKQQLNQSRALQLPEVNFLLSAQ